MIIAWWLGIFLIGLVFLPVTNRLFPRFFDRGYLFSRVLGILAVGYGMWLASSLHLLPFTRLAILLLLGLAVGIIHIAWRNHPNLWAIAKEHKWVILGEEAIFFGALIFWSFIRGLQPNIQGLEKFMDFGFVNAILRTRYFPPADMWFAGGTINYYYFGHYLTAFLTKLCNIPSPVTYNLMIATLFALTFGLTFSLGANLIHLLNRPRLRTVVLAGLLCAVLVTLGGNLHSFIYAHAKPFVQSMRNDKTPVKAYWYPDATRYIGYNPDTKDKTIHEFPIYSFVVSDLHGHVLNIPFVLTLLAILLAMLLKEFDPVANWQRALMECALLGFFLAVFRMTNTWDLPIYLLLIGGVLLYRNFLQFGRDSKVILVTLAQILAIILFSYLLAMPFILNFKNFAKGIGVVRMRSPIYQLLVLWGYQLFLFALFVLFLSRQFYRRKKGSVSDIRTGDVYVLLLGLLSVFLLIVPEVIYLKDIYGGAYFRANTMFKLTYQAFIMLGLIGGYTVFRLLLLKKPFVDQVVLAMVFAVVLALPLVYPFYAIKGYYGEPKVSRFQGLDGLKFMSQSLPDDYRAVLWLNQHVKDQPAILEANGDSYTNYGRISMATGLPTVLGWFVHEWLWRGSSEVASDRVKECATVYESGDMKATNAVLQKYHIRYIILGKLERDKFKKLNEAKLLKLGKPVFASGATQILQVD